MYDVASDTLKGLLEEGNAEKLNMLAEAVADREKSAEAVKEVEEMLEAMPSADDMDLVPEDVQKYTDARNAYEALSDEEKAMVDSDLVEKLEEGENYIAEIMNCNIPFWPDDPDEIEDLTESWIEDMKIIKAMYDVASDTLKGLLEEGNAEKLNMLADAVAAREAEAANEVAALIEALPDADKLTLEDADAVEAAQDAYDALTDEQKKLISTENKMKLTLASAVIDKLKAEDRAETAESTVESLQGQLTQKQNELTAANNRVTELQGTVSTLETQLTEAQTAVAEAEARYNALKTESDADKAELAQAKTDLANAKAAEKEAKDNLDAAKADLATAQSKVTELEGKVGRLEKDLTAEKEKAEAAQGDANKMEEELAELKEKNAILSKTVQKAKAKAKKKSAVVSWKSVGKGFTYEVYRSTNPTKSFKKMKASSKLKVTIKKLKKGKTYYFKVRAFKKVGGKKVYTGYSNIVKAKAK